MRKFVSLSVMLLAVAVMAQGQDGKKKAVASPRVTAKTALAEVSYGQPSKRGRKIFGALVPYGKVWRTGANQSTDLTVHEDVFFGGKDLKKGTYAVFTIPNEKEWTIILNSKSGQHGAFEYEGNKSKNVLEVIVPVEKTATVQEQFTISIEPGNLMFNWDDVLVKVPMVKK